MKKILFTTLMILTLSCTKKDNLTIIDSKEQRVLTVNTVKNLYAPHYDMSVHPIEKILTEEFVKFDFEKGEIVDKEDENWDIGFKGTKIIINGGTKTKPKNEPQRTGETSLAIVKGLFDEIKEIPNNAIFKKDKKNILALPTGSDNGWYNYGDHHHTIKAITGRLLLIKTRLGKYVKMEILSYYKDLNSKNPSSYYSFNYVINPKKGDPKLY